MPLEGLRAWIGEVERKLGMRTRVFLVLTAIAIGGAGAAIYLTLDTRDDAVSEGDVRELQENLETQIAGGASPTGTSLSDLEAELRELKAKVQALEGGDTSGAGSGATGTGATGTGGVPPGTSGVVPNATQGASADGIATDGNAAAKTEAEQTQRQIEAFAEGQKKTP